MSYHDDYFSLDDEAFQEHLQRVFEGDQEAASQLDRHCRGRLIHRQKSESGFVPGRRPAASQEYFAAGSIN